MSNKIDPSMPSKRRENNWSEGVSGNLMGRPVESPEQKEAKKKLSKLRGTEKKLLSLNPKALRVISASLDGEDVDKEQVATAKWVVSTTIAVSKAAMAEETAIMGIKDPSVKSEIEERQAEEDDTPRFSMTMIAEADSVSLQ